MDFIIEAIESPASNADRFLASDEVSGLSAYGATPYRADINLQVAIRNAATADAEAGYQTFAGRQAAATAHNVSRGRGRGNGNGGR